MSIHDLQSMTKAEGNDVANALEILDIRCHHCGTDLTGEHRNTHIIVMSRLFRIELPDRAQSLTYLTDEQLR